MEFPYASVILTVASDYWVRKFKCQNLVYTRENSYTVKVRGERNFPDTCMDKGSEEYKEVRGVYRRQEEVLSRVVRAVEVREGEEEQEDGVGVGDFFTVDFVSAMVM